MLELFHQIVVSAELSLEILYLPLLSSQFPFEIKCRRIFWRVLLGHAASALA